MAYGAAYPKTETPSYIEVSSAGSTAVGEREKLSDINPMNRQSNQGLILRKPSFLGLAASLLGCFSAFLSLPEIHELWVRFPILSWLDDSYSIASEERLSNRKDHYNFTQVGSFSIGAKARPRYVFECREIGKNEKRKSRNYNYWNQSAHLETIPTASYTTKCHSAENSFFRSWLSSLTFPEIPNGTE
ncbi:metalloendopeptidases [Striga asiatica]|uniref:Metalloendopeptidases n=1 Tax=Striga asiatica TaxID=4170 RepID=A0A5A7PYZ2_STRAF|nr:metalloendopeptidases [Striga asiatica]